MEFETGHFDQNGEDEEGFSVVDHMLGDLAMGEHVRIFISGTPLSETTRSLIEDLREAGVEVIVPSDN